MRMNARAACAPCWYARLVSQAGKSEESVGRRVIGLSFHVMNGSAPNPERRVGEHRQGWNTEIWQSARPEPSKPGSPKEGDEARPQGSEDKHLCSALARHIRGFHASIAFSMALKAMAPSVMTAASSERGCHYKSQFGGVHLGGALVLRVLFLSWWCIPCFIPCRG